MPEPLASTRQLRNAILICERDMDHAANLLYGEGPKEIRDAIEFLVGRWSRCNRDEIMEILILCTGDCDQAESRLSQILVDSKAIPQLESKLLSPVADRTQINGF